MQKSNSYNVTKVRIDHPEDLLFTRASDGAIRALAVLEAALDENSEISFKPDGKPAIMWGRDSTGFVMGDKYMDPLPNSVASLKEILLSRQGGNREELVSMYEKLWHVFESSISDDFTGYLFGDLMYSSPPPVVEGKISFTPNTVTYSVDGLTQLAKRIQDSTACIVVHSYFPSESRQGRHISNLNQITGLRTDSPLLVLGDYTTRPEQMQCSDITYIRENICSHATQLNALMDIDELTQGKMKAMPGLMSKYVNSCLRDGSDIDLHGGFCAWLETNTSKSMRQKIIARFDDHATGITAFSNIYNSIAAAKNSIVEQLNSEQDYLHASINGQAGHEGYLMHTSDGPVKLVDRRHFSIANFNKPVSAASDESEVAIIFGRFNPPHLGHRSAWELASQSPNWFVGMNKNTFNENNPMPFATKMSAMELVWPEVKGHIIHEQTWISLASRVFAQFPTSTLVIVTDEQWAVNLIDKYNNVEGSENFYNFKKIVHKKSPRISSATILRDAVINNSEAEFLQASGVNRNSRINGMTYFELVQSHMKEHVDILEDSPLEILKRKAGNIVFKRNYAYAMKEMRKRVEAGEQPLAAAQNVSRYVKGTNQKSLYDYFMKHAEQGTLALAESKLDIAVPSINMLSQKYSIPVSNLLHTVRKGARLEESDSATKDIAVAVALDNLLEDISYYDKKKQLI